MGWGLGLCLNLEYIAITPENPEKALLGGGARGHGLLFHVRDTTEGAGWVAETQAHTHPWEKEIALVSSVFSNAYDDLPTNSMSATATPVWPFTSLQRKLHVVGLPALQILLALPCGSFPGEFLRWLHFEYVGLKKPWKKPQSNEWLWVLLGPCLPRTLSAVEADFEPWTLKCRPISVKALVWHWYSESHNTASKAAVLLTLKIERTEGL